MKPWSFIQNPFLNSTEGSYRAAKKIGAYTDAALGAKPTDPFFIGLYTSFHPLSVNYNDVYVKWVNQVGQQKGGTKSLENLLAELRSDKIVNWDIAIQIVFRVGTPEYIALLPGRRTPFQTGSQQDRIAAVGALEQAIGDILALQGMKTEVSDFFAELTNTYTGQKGKRSSTGDHSKEVEAARVQLCIGLYGVLGKLMDHYKNAPENVATFFDLQTVRNHQQSLYRHNIDGGALLLVLINSFEVGERVRLINRGNTALRFALLPEANDPIEAGGIWVEVPANTEMLVDQTELGAIGNRFLKVLNTSATEEGAYTVELI